MIVLVVSPLDLYPDEAQYWWWSVNLDWGYFSKPPLIAWLIAGVTSVCGEGEACIRVASPLLHGATALILFAIAKLLYDGRAGMWSALAYITTPGVAYSAGLISTDVPLLFFWSAALYAFLKAMRGRGYGWAVLCGVAIGFGLLAKYAMLYFVLGVALTTLIIPESRRLFLSLRGAAIALIALFIFLPNLVWNVQHAFATVTHTASNADWQRGALAPLHPFEFLLGQFGVFGPILMAGYLYAVWRIVRGQDHSQASLLLLLLSLPPILVIMGQALIAEANANWAAAAYVAATPLAVHALMKLWRGGALIASLAFNSIVALALMAFVASPALAVEAGFANAYKRVKGWHELGAVVALEASQGYEAIVTDNRSVIAALLYYARPRSIPILIWNRDLRVANHFEMTLPLTAAHAGRVLLVTEKARPDAPPASFARARLSREFVADLGGGKKRVTLLYEAEGYRPVSDRDRIEGD
ncbi:MAG: ArnT family glycosyltransferase [Alphaproteobacteria bacterium]